MAAAAYEFRGCVVCGLTLQFGIIVAHLDQNGGNNAPDNLAYLCGRHHWMYDARLYPIEVISYSAPIGRRVIDARPDGAGRLSCTGARPTRSTFDSKLSPSMPEARDLVRRVRQLLPSIGEVEPEAVRIAIRPIPGDHLSAIGPVPRTTGYYLAVTHSGVTMSPFLGAAVADEVVRGKERRELADFRPARFFN